MLMTENCTAAKKGSRPSPLPAEVFWSRSLHLGLQPQTLWPQRKYLQPPSAARPASFSTRSTATLCVYEDVGCSSSHMLDRQRQVSCGLALSSGSCKLCCCQQRLCLAGRHAFYASIPWMLLSLIYDRKQSVRERVTLHTSQPWSENKVSVTLIIKKCDSPVSSFYIKISPSPRWQ